MAVISIKSGYFCGGVVTELDYVVDTPPILRRLRGWHISKVIKYCNLKKWEVVNVE